MSEWAYKWISFDMSRDGLIELEAVLSHVRHEFDGPQDAGLSDELHNFYNLILNMLERLPEESSWLDE